MEVPEPGVYEVRLRAKVLAYPGLCSMEYKHAPLGLYMNGPLWTVEGSFSKAGCCNDPCYLRPLFQTMGTCHVAQLEEHRVCICPVTRHCSSLELALQLLIYIDYHFKCLISSHFSFR